MRGLLVVNPPEPPLSVRNVVAVRTRPLRRRVLAAREEWDRLVSRQAIILESIVRHATLAPELRETILATFDPVLLEDLYLPYKQKKKSRAQAAREAGLAF